MKKNIINHKIQKSFSLVLAAGLTVGLSFAQNIELPEVTTVISGDTEKAGTDALPDFSDVLTIPSGSGEVEPVLPGVETSGKTEITAPSQQKNEKSVYAEGLLGGGYPMLFTGNITVFRSVGESPFKFNIEHDTASGYSNHSLTDNYSDRTTKIEIQKSYKKNNFSWSAGGLYKSCSDGLQGNVFDSLTSQKISLLNRDTYFANGSVSYVFSNGFVTGANSDVIFYNRYAEQACSSIPTLSYTKLSPSLFVKWQGHGFDTGITANYSYSTQLNKNNFEKEHRAAFTANLSWKNDYVKLYSDASAVVGNHLNGKPVIVPFTVGIDSSFPVYFANRRFEILAEGGIKTANNDIFELEEKYKFTQINSNTTESSDWYGKLCFTVPLKTAFTGTASAEYHHTAYGNCVYEPDYSSGKSIYSFNQKNHQLLITDFTLSYHYEKFNISGGWHSNWMDVPALEAKQLVNVKLDWQDDASRWGADVSAVLPINAEVETPLLNAGGFVRLTPSVRAILSVNDIIKLSKAESRTYAGKYAARGGSATLLLKFFF